MLPFSRIFVIYIIALSTSLLMTYAASLKKVTFYASLISIIPAYLLFLLSSHLVVVLKFGCLCFYLNSNAFSVINPPDIGLLPPCGSKSFQNCFVYIFVGWFLQPLSTPIARPLSIAVITVSLFLKMMDTVLARIPYFTATSFFRAPV